MTPRGLERGYRQEVLNVLLAQLLQERDLIVAPEQIQHFTQESRRMPDVLVDFQGLRMAIEGELAQGSRGATVAAERQASQAAFKRVEQGIAHIGVALVYPGTLRTISFDKLKAELAKARLRFAIVTESYQQQLSLFPGKEPVQFAEGNLEVLAEALRRAYEQLIEDEVLERAIAALEASIEEFTAALSSQPAATERFKSALELKELPKEGAEEDEQEEGE